MTTTNLHRNRRFKRGFLHTLRKCSKPIAALFIINILSSLIAPSVAHALTSGPTAPEYSSFEPVDTTDMVNLTTGDFVYNMPLLEVPGPAGSYPLSLSYHAGIQPDMEASWVGLGWTLNAGAINRYVDGFPDDHRDAANVNTFHWDGGVRQSAKIGYTFGISGLIGPYAGLEFGHDTYQGFGVGGYVGASVGLSEDGPAGVGIRAGVSPWGDVYASASVNISGEIGENLNAGGSLGLRVGGGSVSGFAGGGVSVDYGKTERRATDKKDESGNTIYKGGRDRGSGSLIGASIGSGGAGISVASQSIASGTFNSKASNVSINSWGITLPLPFVTLGYNYQRYWIHQVDESYATGMLYNTDLPDHGSDLYDYSHDAYDSYTHYDSYADLISEKDPNREHGTTFPSYDNYQVVGQGISGSIRPYNFLTKTHRQDVIVEDENDDLTDARLKQLYIKLDQVAKEPKFRFVGEFSNYYLSSGGSVEKDDNALPNYLSATTPTQTAGLISDNHLAGTKHVDFFTNAEMYDGTAYNDGLVKPNVQGFELVEDDKIGAFKVTNASGVTYHYAVPVYNLDETIYSESEDDEGVKSYSKIEKKEPYAYSWLLTAVTGPDYVDRDNDNMVSEGDWGYWVGFNYGKWGEYNWRNPADGFETDLDENFKNVSFGSKEVYYLDAVYTETHTALFYKSIRADGKGRNYNFQYDIGGYDKPYIQYERVDITESKETYFFPTPSLKLDSVLLVDNSSLSETILTIKESGEKYDLSELIPEDTQLTEYALGKNVHANYVLNDDDNPVNNVIKSVDFSYSYELNKGTINSSDPDGLLYQDENYNTDDVQLEGKLTLKSIEFKGKNGASAIPPTRFEYDMDQNAFQTTYTATGGLNSYGNLNSGDIVEVRSIDDTKKAHFLYKERLVGSTSLAWNLISFVKMDGDDLETDEVVVVRKTKNPPYIAGAHDLWGYFKSDFDENLLDENELLGRMVTPYSASQKDVWSLHKIKNPLGSEISIEYQSDEYSESVLNNNYAAFIKSIEREGDENFKVQFHANNLDLNSLRGNTEMLNGVASLRFAVDLGGSGLDYYYGSIDFSLEIEEIQNDHLIVSSEILNNIYLDEYSGYDDFSNGLPIAYAAVQIGGNRYGNGLRVSSLKVSDGDKASSTIYDYQGLDGVSSGVITYEPFSIGELSSLDVTGSLDVTPDEQTFKSKLYAEYESVLNNAREVPSSGVTYGRVKVYSEIEYPDGTIETPPGYSVNEFGTFKSDMIHIEGLEDDGEDLGAGDLFVVNTGLADIMVEHQSGRSYDRTLHYNAGRVGLPISVVSYDDNDQKIQETRYHYLHDQLTPFDGANDLTRINEYDILLDRFNHIGQIEEVSLDARANLLEESNEYELILNVGRRHVYPVVSLGSEVTDYQKLGTSQSYNLSFDLLTGSPTEVLSISPKGQHVYTKIVPAYKEYAGDFDPIISGGQNLLTHEFATYTYEVDAVTDPLTVTPSGLTKLGVMGASVSLWSDETDVLGATNAEQEGIWRKRATLGFVGQPGIGLLDNGLYPLGSFNEDPVDWKSLGTSGSVITGIPSGWQKNSEITRYDVNSHALEAIDVNGNYAATKFDNLNQRVYATAANASYDEFAYSGAEGTVIKVDGEDYFSGGVLHPSGTIVTNTSDNPVPVHTGIKSVRTTGTGYPFRYWLPQEAASRTFKASVWATDESAQIRYKVDGGTAVSAGVGALKKAGDWYLLEVSMDVPSAFSTVEIFAVRGSGDATIYWDDFRVHPIDATMTSYAYNEWGELSDILDANNLFTHYEYDDMGRLKSVSRETMSSGAVEVSQSEIYYGTAKSTSSLYGGIDATQLDYNTTVLRVSLDNEGSGDYETTWTIDGTEYIVDGLTLSHDVTATVEKDIIVEVVDNVTGTSFETYKEVTFLKCPDPGSEHSAGCQLDENGCLTGWYITYVYGDNCNKVESDRVYDESLCDVVNDPNCENPE